MRTAQRRGGCAGVLAAVLSAAGLLQGCSRQEEVPPPAAPVVDDGRPLEARPPNAREYQPAFPGQTRARGVRRGVALDVQVITGELMMPWAVEPLPDGRFLVSERNGKLRLVGADGTISAPVSGVPEVDFSVQGGLHDVALDPRFAGNQLIYLTYTESRETGNGESLARARLVESAGGVVLEDLKVIFRQLPDFKSDRQLGSRIVFAADGKLFLALGERGEEAAVGQAQNLQSHFGKVVRLNADGSVPADNPLAGRRDARPEIWSWGHRNIQSAAIDPASGALWTVEHGPLGGDELNRIEPGRNYGWPVISYGLEYNGRKIGSGATQQQGLEQPVYYWDPEIMPSGMLIYRGGLFPEWQGSILVGGLASQKLVRLELADGKVVGEEWLLQDRRQRVRDVQQGPDGSIYVLTENADRSQLLRLRPATGGTT